MSILWIPPTRVVSWERIIFQWTEIREIYYIAGQLDNIGAYGLCDAIVESVMKE